MESTTKGCDFINQMIQAYHKQNYIDPVLLYQFCKITRGNWRNAMYLDGYCTLCHNLAENCKDFMLAISENGAPVLFQAKQIACVSGEHIDRTECFGQMPFEQLMELFSYWSLYNIDSPLACPKHYARLFSESAITRKNMNERRS